MSAKNDQLFTSRGFYGKQNKRKWIGLERSIESTVKKYQQEKIPKAFPSRILGPSTNWETFFRQQDAFNFSRSTSKDLHVFAFESDSFEGNTGQRMYLAASYPVFWHYYSQMNVDKKYHYEVIPEGSVCKLYFDLEFDNTVNNGRDGNAMVETFIKFICLALNKEFNLNITCKNILDLDASTERKCSRHLVFQLTNAAFKDNIHAGRFVCYALSKLLQRLEAIQQSTEVDTGVTSGVETVLTYNNSIHTTNDTTVDTSIHTTNNTTVDIGNTNQTRLNVDNEDSITSDKEDKTHSGENRCTPNTDSTGHNEGLIESMSESSSTKRDLPMEDGYSGILDQFSIEELQSLLVKNKHDDDTLFCDTGVYTKNRNFRLYQSAKLHKNNPLELSTLNKYKPLLEPGISEQQALFYDSLVANVQYTSALRILTFTKESHLRPRLASSQQKSSQPREQADCTLDGYSKSPYPEVDEYITRLITQDSGKGVIRHWTYFQQGELLVYEIAKYRFCHNIGRQHKSNNIMMIADLLRGVYYQKCHDPDCHVQNYKSPEWPLPRNVLPASYFDDLGDQTNQSNIGNHGNHNDLQNHDNHSDLDMDDEELLNTTAELEKQYFQQKYNVVDELEDGRDDDILESVQQLEASVLSTYNLTGLQADHIT